MSQQVVNGKPGWYLAVGKHGYLIEPQVSLGLGHGVRIPSRADFLIRPERASGDVLPIAVFTDGFEFHADPASGSQRVGLDSAQRLALMRSGRYRVWSLTWDDVDERFRVGVEPTEAVLSLHWTRQQNLLTRLDPAGVPAWTRAQKMSSFELLMLLLCEPTLNWRLFSQTTLGSMSEPSAVCARAWAKSARERLLDEALTSEWPGTASPGDECVNGAFWHPPLAGARCLAVFVFGSADAVRQRDLSTLVGTLRICEESAGSDFAAFKRSWRAYWRLVNQLQFADRFELVSSSGLRDGLYGNLLAETLTLGSRAPINEQLAILMELASDEVRVLLQAIAESGVGLPDVGFELTAADGEIVAEAELAWPAKRVAVVTTAQALRSGEFVRAGWRVWIADEVGPPRLELFASLGDETR